MFVTSMGTPFSTLHLKCTYFNKELLNNVLLTLLHKTACKGFLAKPSLETTPGKGTISNAEQRMLLVLLLRFHGAEERSRFPPDLPRPGGCSRPLSWADSAAWLHLEGRELIFPLNSQLPAGHWGGTCRSCCRTVWASEEAIPLFPGSWGLSR